MKFYGGVLGDKRDKWLDFGRDLDTQLVYKRILPKFWKRVADRAQQSCMERLWLFKKSVQAFECTSPKPVADKAQAFT